MRFFEIFEIIDIPFSQGFGRMLPVLAKAFVKNGTGKKYSPVLSETVNV